MTLMEFIELYYYILFLSLGHTFPLSSPIPSFNPFVFTFSYPLFLPPYLANHSSLIFPSSFALLPPSFFYIIPPSSLPSLSLLKNDLSTGTNSDQDGGELHLCRRHLWRRDCEAITDVTYYVRRRRSSAMAAPPKGDASGSKKGWVQSLFWGAWWRNQLYCKTHGVALCYSCAL